jgi:uncharacterized protein
VTPRRSPTLSFALGAPVGTLGGLIGLGGAEFRLPLLVSVLRYPTRTAVPLNLAISLFTVAAGLATRLSTGGREQLVALGDAGAVVASLLAGGMIGAYIGATWLARVTDVVLERVILVLLVSIGGLLLYEAFASWEPSALVSGTMAVAGAGLVCGLGIGMVSSMLGVAGGELIIPTLILVFGMDVKLAGTASLLISLPTILVGLVRHRQKGAFREPADLRRTVLPMGAGSVLGAVIGGILVAHVSSSLLKLLLGALLIGSAIKVFWRHEG